jgi:hypothetical protein
MIDPGGFRNGANEMSARPPFGPGAWLIVVNHPIRANFR